MEGCKVSHPPNFSWCQSFFTLTIYLHNFARDFRNWTNFHYWLYTFRFTIIGFCFHPLWFQTDAIIHEYHFYALEHGNADSWQYITLYNTWWHYIHTNWIQTHRAGNEGPTQASEIITLHNTSTLVKAGIDGTWTSTCKEKVHSSCKQPITEQKVTQHRQMESNLYLRSLIYLFSIY